jgi:transcriptional regulator with XRE-family HTH domain
MKRTGSILKAGREEKGMTQAALSSATGLTVRTIIDIENGKRNMRHEALYKILHVLDLSADHIYWPERTPYTPDQEQLIRAIATCSERDKKIFMDMAWAFVRAANGGNSPK